MEPSKINKEPSFPEMPAQKALPREIMNMIETAAELGSETIGASSETSDKALRWLSSQERNFPKHFEAGKSERKTVPLESEHHVDNAAIPVITNRSFAMQMKNTLGHHHAVKGKTT